MIALAAVLLDLSLGPVPPPVVDLRPDFARYGLAVRQQGRRGACQVFACLGPLEFDLARKGRPAVLAPQYLMWAANAVCGLSRTGGFNPDYLHRGLKAYGVCAEPLMPYVPREEPVGEPSAAARTDAADRARVTVKTIKHWREDIGFGPAQMRAITAELDAGRPVTVTLCWPFGVPNRLITDGRRFLIDRHIDGASKNGHGVVLVGYGRGDRVPGGGYFVVRNSWGLGFAGVGHCLASFAFAAKYGTDAYYVTMPD